VDRPDEETPPFEAAVGRLLTPLTARGPEQFWCVRVDGHLVGMATVGFPDDENGALAMTDIRVHPDHRRRGIGTALLRAALPTMRERHRATVAGWGVTAGGAGSRWAETLGFRVVHHDVLQVLDLGQSDPERWDTGAPAGYRIARWAGSAPDDLLVSYARARVAIHDAPSEDTSYRDPQWTPERVREAEADLRRRRIEQRVVVGVHETTGEVAGLTEVELHDTRPDFAYQGDTAVLPSHRGRRIGTWIKSHMIQWLRYERPAVRRIGTSTAASNTHMIRINHELGFETLRRMVDVEAEVAALSSRLEQPA
jgi:ribosomal protein S18 acetylase RimI-like enzyme